MAEASCSGTTPFKRLIDHQSSGINHQDRLTSSAGGPHASFRSPPALQHDHHAQNAFGAFVAAPSALPGLAHDPATRLAAHVSTLQPVPAPSYPHAQQQQHHHYFAQQQPQLYAPLQDSSSIGAGNHPGSSWAADFSRFSAAQAQRRAPFSTAPPTQQFSFATQYSNNNTTATASTSSYPGFYSGATQGTYLAQQQQQQQRQHGGGDFDQEMARWMSAHGGGNMADVDAAMDQMALELEESAAAAAAAAQTETQSDMQTETIPTQMKQELDRERERERGRDAEAEFAKLSLEVNDARAEQEQAQAQHELLDESANTAAAEEQQQHLEDESEEGENAGEHGRSGVAEAAEKLLECVKHEEGEKWQNSVFLSLMRDFRDGRKDIVGDEIRTNGEAGTEGLEGGQQAQASG